MMLFVSVYGKMATTDQLKKRDATCHDNDSNNEDDKDGDNGDDVDDIIYIFNLYDIVLHTTTSNNNSNVQCIKSGIISNNR